MNNDTILYVARYMEGDMDELERTDFETQLANDAGLQQQVEAYKNVHETLKQEIAPTPQQKELEQTLAKLNQQYFKDEAKVVSLKPYIKWLSGVAAVLFIGLMLWAPWKQSLYDSFAIHDTIAVAERGNSTQDDFTIGATAYNTGDFRNAEAHFAKAYQTQPENTRNAYYYALTLAQNKKPGEARTVLTKIYKGTSVYRYDAAYALALTYLKEKDIKETKNWLNKIPEGSNKHENATKLLKELK